MFQNFKQEAWRLEMLPQYRVPQEAEEVQAFRDGKRIDPASYASSYTERLIRQHSEGKRNGRVHVVTRPLSEYLRFEFSRYYRAHALAGEEIRILDVTDRPNPLADAQDFWLFDRSTVVLMNYEPDGKQIGRKLYEGDPAQFLEYQRIALAESVPFAEYAST
ncbi:hypothetical protein GCM10009802_17280 [Streptomyces synnematoformans]|uniref:DUF6879 domain-containing protein n=2 Tax=Streptomyces synnematoformans TaxID=415721 RepID=A0ABN2XV30_9ACTN